MLSNCRQIICHESLSTYSTVFRQFNPFTNKRGLVYELWIMSPRSPPITLDKVDFFPLLPHLKQTNEKRYTHKRTLLLPTLSFCIEIYYLSHKAFRPFFPERDWMGILDWLEALKEKRKLQSWNQVKVSFNI